MNYAEEQDRGEHVHVPVIAVEEHKTSLVRVHAVLFVLHLASGIAVACMPVQYYVKFDDDLSDDRGLRLDAFIYPFFFLAAIDHFLCFIDFDCYALILNSRDTVWMRWIEYSVSASIMNMEIVLACRCKSFEVVVLVAVITCTCMLIGGLSEDQDQKGRIALTAIAWGAFAGVWAFILNQFFHNKTKETPQFVVVIVFLLFVLEACFGLVFVLFFNADTTRMVYTRELFYAALSLTSKICLGWISYSGIKARESTQQTP